MLSRAGVLRRDEQQDAFFVHHHCTKEVLTISKLTVTAERLGYWNLQNSRYLSPVFRSIDPKYPSGSWLCGAMHGGEPFTDPK